MFSATRQDSSAVRFEDCGSTAPAVGMETFLRYIAGGGPLGFGRRGQGDLDPGTYYWARIDGIYHTWTFDEDGSVRYSVIPSRGEGKFYSLELNHEEN